jgi:hypothetical protein
LSHKQQDKKQDRGGSKLDGEDDGGAYSDQPDIVNVDGAECLERSVGGVDLEVLSVDIEAGREDGGCWLAVFGSGGACHGVHDRMYRQCGTAVQC